MKRVLLIADLEGVAGVDSVEDLIAGSPGYERARELLTAELNHAIGGLLAAGYEAVRVSDSHQSGSGEPSVLREALHPSAELCFEENWYSARMFEGVSAVACLGMHAAAGTAGFAPHTVDFLSTWEHGGQRLSEVEILLALAAEEGVPVGFVSGDDVLEASLGGRVAFVRTKQALSPRRACSRVPGEVYAELARAAALPPRPVPPPPAAPLVLAFKSARQAERAAAASDQRVDRYRVALDGRGFRERFERGLMATYAANEALAKALRGPPGTPEFVEDAAALLLVPPPPVLPAPPDVSYVEAAHRALQAFLALTGGAGEEVVVLRALVLHMLEGHAPALFARWELGATLEAAVKALSALPVTFPLALSPDVAEARVDACYVRRVRGLRHPAPEPRGFARYLEHLHGSGYSIHAWLLGELQAACGLDERLYFPERPLRGHSRLGDLYWLTHLYLLDTRYLHAPLRERRAADWTEELLVAVPWLVAEQMCDLGAEVAICLQAAGEAAGGAHRMLLGFLAARQQPDGRVVDAPDGDVAEQAHCTGAALLAFAGAEVLRAEGP